MAEPRTADVGVTGAAASNAVRLIGIRTEPLSVDEVLASVADPNAGGTTVFVGTVRSVDEGHPVVTLEYEAHPDAVTVLRQVAEEIAAKHAPVAVAAVHRIGLLSIGDLAVVVAAAAGHRGEAFVAARDLIDEVKARVPIWKRQSFADGGVAWVGIETTLDGED